MDLRETVGGEQRLRSLADQAETDARLRIYHVADPLPLVRLIDPARGVVLSGNGAGVVALDTITRIITPRLLPSLLVVERPTNGAR